MPTRSTITLFVLIILILPVVVHAEGLTPSKYEDKAKLCEICHEHSDDPYVPRLAGQSAKYLLKQLNEYKQGARESAIMNMVVNSFQSEQEMKGVAEYFSQLASTNQKQTPGEAFYDGKHMFEQTYACAGCHGFDGKGGNEQSLVIPVVAGQKKMYLVQRLISFREAKHDDVNPMTRVAKKLTDENITLVADYLSNM